MSLIQRNERLVEALGILDYLAEAKEPASSVASTQPADGRRLGPSPYEITTWRGVVLMRGQQTAAARQALDAAAALRPDRPEAYYWRAMLEYREGQFEAARMFLHNALATSARFAPAWEALGQIALNADDPEAALADLQKAVESNERRAAAHFSIAIAHAKMSQRGAAAEALKTAFRLDRSYVEKAQATEVLSRLFTPDELQALATAKETSPGNQGSGGEG